MSVDKTIEELSGTLAQLGVLVEHINAQIIGITSRINVTLDNFDSSVAGIASDAGVMTGQVRSTTPLQSIVYSESKQPLNISYPGSPHFRERLRHIAVPMESEPRRFGYSTQKHSIVKSNNNETNVEGNVGSAVMFDIPITTHEPQLISRSHPYKNAVHSNINSKPKSNKFYPPQNPQTQNKISPAFINPRAEAV